MYNALNELVGAKVVRAEDDIIVFDNGLKIVCEDLSCYINVSEFKEAK